MPIAKGRAALYQSGARVWHIVSTRDFSREFIEYIFSIADKGFPKKPPLDRRMILANILYEPSTRTRLSFESAMLRLGGSYISSSDASKFSSAAKGETLEDTVRVVATYADVIELRHTERGAAE